MAQTVSKMAYLVRIIRYKVSKIFLSVPNLEHNARIKKLIVPIIHDLVAKIA